MDVTELYLNLEAEYERRRVRSSVPGRPDTVQKNRDVRFIESVGFTLDGHVYDPNLLDYRAALEFGLTQSQFRERIDHWSNSEHDTGFLTEYDISIDAFKTKPVSLHAYARRSDDRISRRFLPSLHEEVTETGVSVLAVKGPFTTEMGFSLRDVNRSGNRKNLDDEDLETTRFYIDHKWEISENQRLRLLWDHGRDESTYQGSGYTFDTSRDEVRLEHELAFGPQSKHRLDTYFRYNEEHGDLARDEIELVPRLTLQHTDKFKTIHRYGFYRFEQDAIEVNQHKFDTEAIWTPHEHWRITADGYGLYEGVDSDVDTYEFGGSFDVAYDRPTSLGQLSANVALAYDQSRTIGDAGRRYVRNEAHQMHAGVAPIFLRERGVIAGTVIAHNATRTRVFVPGVDYNVTVTAGRAVVQRLATGRIAEDEVVYFDYAYLVPAHATVHTYRTDFLIEHEFKFGLTPYYGYESRCQEVETSRAYPWGRDNTHRHRLGARYRRPRWSVGAEYEVFDDTVEPYDAYHLTGRVDLLRSAAHSLDLSAELSRYYFEGGVDERRVWWFDIDLRDRMRVNEYLSFVGSAAYRWEDDSRDDDTNSVDIECGLQFIRGYLTVDLTVEYDVLSLARNEDSGFGVFLNVRRDLTHLLPQARASR